MNKYTWAWYDGDDIYINQSKCLEEIIENILDYYFHTEDNEFTIQATKSNGKISVLLALDYSDERYEIDCNEISVANFLKEMATIQHRPDRFKIYQS